MKLGDMVAFDFNGTILQGVIIEFRDKRLALKMSDGSISDVHRDWCKVVPKNS